MTTHDDVNEAETAPKIDTPRAQSVRGVFPVGAACPWPQQVSLRQRLIELLPMLDLTWPDELRSKWFECVEGLWLWSTAPVAQLDRALGSEPRGQRFESARERQC